MSPNSETLIQTIQSLHQEAGALTWVILGIMFPIFIISTIVVLR